MENKSKSKMNPFLAAFLHLVAAILGGITGAAAGRVAFGVGAVSIGGGQYLVLKNNQYGTYLISFGAGAIASGGGMLTNPSPEEQPAETVSGLRGQLDNAKARAKLQALNYTKTLYLDKLGIQKLMGLGEAVERPVNIPAPDNATAQKIADAIRLRKSGNANILAGSTHLLSGTLSSPILGNVLMGNVMDNPAYASFKPMYN